MKTFNIFSNRVTSIFVTLFVCALWGSLYPFIKIGYNAFAISSSDIPSIMLFAGLRFTFSGLILIAMLFLTGKEKALPKKSDIKPLFYVALSSIVLHYSFTYIALSLGEGSKSAIVKQVGILFLSCFAFLFDKTDKFTLRKLFAGIIGFAGIIITSFDGTGFSFKVGDILLILASFCSVWSIVASKDAVKSVSPASLVAYTQFGGGAVMLIAGICFGGKISVVNAESVGVFTYLCVSSIVAYVMWNILLKYNSLSKLSVIKFAEPLCAVIFSGIFLGENILKLSYLVALFLIFIAIVLQNTKAKE